MAWLGIILTVAGVWVPASNLWGRLPKTQAADLRRWLRQWVIKGLATPLALWLIFNSDFSESFPPILGQIQAAAPGLATVEAWLDAAGTGLLVISSFWAAVTLGWLLVSLGNKWRTAGY